VDCPETFLPLTETRTPADQAAVAQAVRDAVQAGTPVYPVGGGTAADYGARPTRPGMAIVLRALDRVIDYPADDMTITVEAGITMADLVRRLAEHRQRLPIEVAQPAKATLGGVVATDVSGPRRLVQGTIRDYVLALSAVDGCGNAFSTGARVVKNVAGYNLCRLMVGSLGTLGVITQVTLMVRPQPESSALVSCDVPDFDAAERLVAGMVRTETLPVAVELLAGCLGGTGDAIGPLHSPAVARLIVGFEGSPREVEWMVDQLVKEWRASGMASVSTAFGADAAPLWDALAEFPADAEIRVPPSRSVPLAQQLLQRHPDGSIQVHAGNGVIRLRLPLPAGDGRSEGILPLAAEGNAAMSGSPAEVVRQLGEVRQSAVAAGGNMVLLRQPPGAVLTPREVWGPPANGVAVMRAIKERFDPQGLLNPGRFIYED